MNKKTQWLTVVIISIVLFGMLTLFFSYLSAHPEADCIYGDANPGNNIAECKPAPVREEQHE